ncbi:MAG: tetratricopeptide repeat protein [Bacteroidota bacterium]
MKNRFILLALSILLSYSVYSQSNKLDKKLEKAYSYIKKDKLDDAADYLDDLLKDNPDYGEGWDLLIKVRVKQYDKAQKTDVFMQGNFTITTKDKDGKEVKAEDDTLAQSLMKMMSEISPSKTAKKKYIDEARRATLICNEAYYASMLLRITFVDPEIDTNVSKKALKYFNDGEDEFENKNYEKAARQYKRAVEQQPDFYKASLYLGDAYYFLGYYDDAYKYFNEAVNKFPKMLEPRKYLIDTYAKLKQFKKAADEAINALMVYPDFSLYEKLVDALYLNDKKLNIK